MLGVYIFIIITSSYKFFKNNNKKWKPSELQKNLLPRVFKSLIFSIPILLTDPLLDVGDTFHFGKMQQTKKGICEAYPHFFLLYERAIVRRQLIKENMLEKHCPRWTSFRQDYGDLGLRNGFPQNRLRVPCKMNLYQIWRPQVERTHYAFIHLSISN